MGNSLNRLALGGVAVAVTIGMAAPAGATDRTVELRPVPGATIHEVTLIADDGTVVGKVGTTDGYHHAVRWDRHGRATALHPLPGQTQSGVTAMNSRGDPIGYSNAPALIGDNAVRWDRRGRISRLPSDYTTSSAVDINDSGVIAGQVYPGMYGQAVRWSADGTITYLPVPPDASISRAVAISAQGTIAGQAYAPVIGGPEYAVRWKLRGGVEVLDAVPGAHSWSLVGIDDHDQVVGTVTTGTGSWAVRWDSSGQVDPLPLPPGGISSGALYVGDQGVVLGVVQTTTGWVAVRWDGIQPTVLAVPGSTDAFPAAVNDHGVVVGHATRPDGSTTAVRWDGDGVTTLPGTSAVAINNRGEILGYAASGPVVWR
jgi:uncharacterized membrane protein